MLLAMLAKLGIACAILLPCAALAFALWKKGPTRGVKIALVVLVLGFVALQVVQLGGLQGAGFLLLLVVVNLGSMLVSTQLVRNPLRMNLSPVTEDRWPAYARRELATFTADFSALGFEASGDAVSTWTMMGDVRRSYSRFLRHTSGTAWAEIHAQDNPKMVARVVATAKTGGLQVLTTDKQSNHELFDDPLTRVQRLPASSNCATLWHSHQEWAVQSPGTEMTVADPKTTRAELHDAWTNRLLQSGQIRAAGDNWVVSLRRMLPLVLRVYGAWFH